MVDLFLITFVAILCLFVGYAIAYARRPDKVFVELVGAKVIQVVCPIGVEVTICDVETGVSQKYWATMDAIDQIEGW